MAGSGTRWLLIGRRALVALGLPVLTADYDFWIDIDGIESFNAAAASCGLIPDKTADAARATGRYVVEGDERVDVLVARQVSTRDGVVLRFEDAWSRRRAVPYEPGLSLWIPSIPDLILTKKWSLRAKAVQDIDLLEALSREEPSS